MPSYFAFLNCFAAQACFTWAGLFKCVIASYDRCARGSLLDFTQQIWIMLKWAVNWRGYANMSQMGLWEAGGGDTPTVYGGASVWQVHHSVIKGHIITYNMACMTIAGINAVPQRIACCVLQLFWLLPFLYASPLQISSQLLTLRISLLCKGVCVYLPCSNINKTGHYWLRPFINIMRCFCSNW